jgi:hypothetical protein
MITKKEITALDLLYNIAKMSAVFHKPTSYLALYTFFTPEKSLIKGIDQ